MGLHRMWIDGTEYRPAQRCGRLRSYCLEERVYTDLRLTGTIPFSCRQDERRTAEPGIVIASLNGKQTRGWSLTRNAIIKRSIMPWNGSITATPETTMLPVDKDAAQGLQSYARFRRHSVAGSVSMAAWHQSTFASSNRWSMSMRGLRG